MLYVALLHPFCMCLTQASVQKVQIHRDRASKSEKGSFRYSIGGEGKPKTGWLHSQMMLKGHQLHPISVSRTHWVVRTGMDGLPQSCIGEGKFRVCNLSTYPCVCSYGKSLCACRVIVWQKDVPGEVQSCEAPSCHPYSRPLRRVITSNFVS